MSTENKHQQMQTCLSRSVSRRALLQIGLLAGFGITQAGLNLGLSNPATAQTAKSVSEQPQSGGILTCRLAGDPPNFDMISNATFMTQNAMAPIYNNLVMYDPMNPNRVIGELAEKWEISPDGKIYTFSLIKGVKFHDGKPFTSADVKYTFDLVRNPPKGLVSLRKAMLATIDGIETPDEHTVRFVLKQPSASLVSILASGWMAVLPKHILEEKGDMKKDAIGTGPFKLKNYTRGVSLELVRNPDYHIKGRPYLDGVKFFIIPDSSTALSNLRTGQILFQTYMLAEDAHTSEKEYANKVVIQGISNLGYETLNFNGKKAPWNDIRVRQAVSLAVNRYESIKIIAQGDGNVSGYMPPISVWALSPAELEKIPGYGKDQAANIANAKKLLAEAGHPNGFSTTLLTRKGPNFEPLSVFLKDQLAKINIEAKLDVQETAAAYDLVNKRLFDLLPWVHGMSVDDPDAVFSEFYTCDAVRNYSDICSQEVDALFAKQSQTINVDERKTLVAQMEKTALMNCSKLIIYAGKLFIGLSPSVRNYKIHPSVYNNQRLQDVWLAKK